MIGMFAPDVQILLTAPTESAFIRTLLCAMIILPRTESVPVLPLVDLSKGVSNHGGSIVGFLDAFCTVSYVLLAVEEFGKDGHVCVSGCWLSDI